MKKVISVSRNSKSDYKVTFEDEEIVITNDTYFKFKHLLYDVLSDSDYEMINDDNRYNLTYYLGIKKLKKMMTKKEMYDYLSKHESKEAIIKQVIYQFEQKGYIDDIYYAKTYILSKENVEGPNLIKSKLMKKGIQLDILNNLIKSDQKEIIANLVNKKLKTVKNKSKNETYQLIKRYLLSKGFELDEVELSIKRVFENYKFNDVFVLNIEYQKLRNKLSHKHTKENLNEIIIKKLYQKGFLINDIKNIVK